MIFLHYFRMHSCWSFQVKFNVFIYAWVLVLYLGKWFVWDTDSFEWLWSDPCSEVIFGVGLEWVVINAKDFILAELYYFVLLFIVIVVNVVDVIIQRRWWIGNTVKWSIIVIVIVIVIVIFTVIIIVIVIVIIVTTINYILTTPIFLNQLDLSLQYPIHILCFLLLPIDNLIKLIEVFVKKVRQ